MSREVAVETIAAFLCSIGIETRADETASGFIDDVKIDHGRLLYRKNVHPAELLHEAGHVAIMPSRWRPLLSGNIMTTVEVMFAEINRESWNPDDIRYRAALQSGDTEATAWAWAAGTHLGLARDEKMNLEDPRAYEGEADLIARMLESRKYFGIHGLQHAGFCRAGAFGDMTLPRYPALAFWLQR